ncbi:MAG: hypothetical protein ACLURV_13070 [Gallintestinimicrobium sp.]
MKKKIPIFTAESSAASQNDGALAGYPTASLFFHLQRGGSGLVRRMGMSESKVFYCFDGQTPLSAALLNVRYLFSAPMQRIPASTR